MHTLSRNQGDLATRLQRLGHGDTINRLSIDAESVHAREYTPVLLQTEVIGREAPRNV
jgi:hypothetical protein